MLLCVIVLLCYVVLLCDIVLFVVLMWYPVAPRQPPRRPSQRQYAHKMRSMRSIISLGLGRAFVLYRRAGVVRSVGLV